jgi:hypothetical protein
MNELESAPEQGNFGLGIFIGFALNVVVAVLGFVYPFLLFMFIGVAQLVYIMPLYFYLRKTARKDTARGLLIAAAITALLNATCWGVGLNESH